MRLNIILIVASIAVIGLLVFIIIDALSYIQNTDETIVKDLHNDTDKPAKANIVEDDSELDVEIQNDKQKINECLSYLLSDNSLIQAKDECIRREEFYSKCIDSLEEYRIRNQNLKNYDTKADQLVDEMDSINKRVKILQKQFDEACSNIEVEKAKKIVEKERQLELRSTQIFNEVKVLFDEKIAERNKIVYGVKKINAKCFLLKFGDLLSAYNIEELEDLFYIESDSNEELRNYLKNNRVKLRFLDIKKFRIVDDHALVSYSAQVKNNRNNWFQVTRSNYLRYVDQEWFIDFAKEKQWHEAKSIIEKLIPSIDDFNEKTSGIAQLSSEKFVNIEQYLTDWNIDKAVFNDLKYFELENFVIKKKSFTIKEYYIACIAKPDISKSNKTNKLGMICFGAENDVWFENYFYRINENLSINGIE